MPVRTAIVMAPEQPTTATAFISASLHRIVPDPKPTVEDMVPRRFE
jgi:hypothetical protein